jgi:RNA polymerase sigma factor (sigma-70 family)
LYDPSVSKFITWVSVIVKREIWKVAKHRDAQKRQIPITPIINENTDGDFMEDNRLIANDCVEDTVVEKIMIQELRKAVNTLNEKQRKIYQMYFVEEKTLSAIGKSVGLSHEGVRLNVEKIKKHLKNHFIKEDNQIGA